MLLGPWLVPIHTELPVPAAILVQALALALYELQLITAEPPHQSSLTERLGVRVTGTGSASESDSIGRFGPASGPLAVPWASLAGV